MSWRYTDLPALYHSENGAHRGELKALLLGYVKDAGGNLSAAAEALGVARRILYGYLWKLDLMPEVQGFRDQKTRRNRMRTPEPSAFVVKAQAKPDWGRDMLLWALTSENGEVKPAAEGLGIRPREFLALARELGIMMDVQRIRRAGLKTRGRAAPRKATYARQAASSAADVVRA